MTHVCRFAVGAAVFAILVSSAWGEGAPAPAVGKSDLAAVAGGNNAFAFDLYGRLRAAAKVDENLFLSPMSISTALGMTYSGARGETASQMSTVLHLAADRKAANEALGALTKHLNALGASGKFQLTVANGLWVQKGYPFLPDYIAEVRGHYDAGLEELNFAESEAARGTINGWVEKKTNDRIKDLIPPGILGPLTRLVLTNAIYFKGDWDKQFKDADTKDEPFLIAPDKKVDVPLMRQKDKFGYLKGDGFQVLEMTYGKGDLSMLVLLPDQTDGMSQLEPLLTAENLGAWLKGMRRRTVNVFLPRFKMTVQFELSKTLAEMGMPLAFDPIKANFSGMTVPERIFVSAVIHKAFVEVNEKGTEAAAATAVVGAGGAAPMQPATFRADHPFIFLIRDNASGSILFMGRLVNPKG